VFLVSLALVVRYLMNGTGLDIAKQSVVIKTLVLYLIMITGAIWEKEVFGQYLFAPMFWWEDFVSMGVIALHTIYLAIAYYDIFSPVQQLAVILAAYTLYVINAAQFVYKLRMARLGAARSQDAAVNARGTA
jgi:3-vinyl bacteriochlorophyllide hydratase